MRFENPFRIPAVLIGGGLGLAVGAAINLTLRGMTWHATVLVAVLGAVVLDLWWWRRRVMIGRQERNAYNCAACGKHMPSPARVPAPDWATHKGWLGLCPIWLSLIDDDGPVVEPRFRSFAWLMPVSRAIFGVCFTVRMAFDRDYVPAWPLRITGEVHTRAGGR